MTRKENAQLTRKLQEAIAIEACYQQLVSELFDTDEDKELQQEAHDATIRVNAYKELLVAMGAEPARIDAWRMQARLSCMVNAAEILIEYRTNGCNL